MSAGRRAVFVDGVVQSVDSADAVGGYWEAMLPLSAPSSALLLGLGAGTLAHLLMERFGPLPIVGVERSERMIAIARQQFAVDETGIEIVHGDAFAYVHQSERRFGFIAVDLYDANRLVRGVLALPFLKALAARLEPGGSVAYNLFRDVYFVERLGRLERVFHTTRVVDVGANSAVHGRHRRQR